MLVIFTMIAKTFKIKYLMASFIGLSKSLFEMGKHYMIQTRFLLDIQWNIEIVLDLISL